VVGEPVEQGGSEREVAGDLHPAREAETRSDAEAMALVHLDTKLERQDQGEPNSRSRAWTTSGLAWHASTVGALLWRHRVRPPILRCPRPVAHSHLAAAGW
jgi:hypothetical protein